MFASSVIGRFVDSVDSAPWGASSGRHVRSVGVQTYGFVHRSNERRPLYTPEEKRRRDASPWTLVQGILAPFQFCVFLASVVLVMHFMLTQTGEQAATASIVVKTLVLYAIMVTGAIWEKKVFGRYLFAPAFYWEDAMSMVVIALHTAYLACLLSGLLDTRRLMLLALVAYVSYLINAAQFVLKLRAARLGAQDGWHQAARGLRQA